MIQKIDERVGVLLFSDDQTGRILPRSVRWQGRDYFITQMGLHHCYRQGRTLYHVFSVLAGTIFLRLVLNTDNLQWRLAEVADGF